MKKFTLIIGSGIHNQTLKDSKFKNSCLISWGNLLKELGVSDLESPLLAFESLILKNAKELNVSASKVEKVLLNEISKKIKDEEEKIMKDTSINYPLQIFNPEKVSDVIILNFDLTIEKLLNNGIVSRKKQVVNLKDYKLFYREIKGIRFWHPHGDIYSPTKIQFGLRKYGMNISEVEYLRKVFKQIERNDNYDLNTYNTTWYSAMITNPLIFIGTGLSCSEWTLWYTLISRKRNFALKGREDKIYTLNIKDAYCKLKDFTDVSPILNNCDYNKAWTELINFLK